MWLALLLLPLPPLMWRELVALALRRWLLLLLTLLQLPMLPLLHPERPALPLRRSHRLRPALRLGVGRCLGCDLRLARG